MQLNCNTRAFKPSNTQAKFALTTEEAGLAIVETF